MAHEKECFAEKDACIVYIACNVYNARPGKWPMSLGTNSFVTAWFLLELAERHPLAGSKIIKPACLGKSRHAHRPDLFRPLLRRRQRHRIFAVPHLGAPAGPGRARIEPCDRTRRLF